MPAAYRRAAGLAAGSPEAARSHCATMAMRMTT